MDINDLRIIGTLAAFIAFVAVWAWAWSGKRKKRFSDAANQLFSEEEERIHTRSLEEARK